MARETSGSSPESVISIIGPGMTVVGDCETSGTVRIEGKVEGSVKAGKAVVIGKQGTVVGDVLTQDAVISGHVTGTLVAESRLELQATCQIDGEIRTRRMQLEEGAVLNGTVQMGGTKKAGTAAPAGSGGPGAAASGSKPAGNTEKEQGSPSPAPAGR
jgi:cytoskeletal protein CcmA (bactofilin family)